MSSGGDAAVDAVVSTVGLWWPDAEAADLRAAADAWDRMATVLDRIAADGRSALAPALRSGHGATAIAIDTYWTSTEGDGLAPSAEGCRALASALRQYADEVEDAEHEIELLAVEVGATIAVGAATAMLTFGAGAAVAGGIAARLVAVAASIGMRVSQSAAAIASTTLAGATFGAVDAAAVAGAGQVFRVEVADDGGYAPGEIATTAAWGAAGGAALGGAGGAWASRALRDPAPSPELLRGAGGAIRAALEPTDWGPLHRAWRPGLDESAQRLQSRERPTARFLADEGLMVHSRRPRHQPNYGDPDLFVRSGPRDPGRYVELKALENDSSTAVAKGVRGANQQLRAVGGGQVVIDGRAADLTETVARDGWARAVRNMERAGETPPQVVRILLGRGELNLP